MKTVERINPKSNNLPTAFANTTDRPKVIIGSANLHRPQRYSHKDPAPWLQFPDEKNSIDLEAVIYAGIGSVLVVLIAGLMFYCAA